MAPVCNKGLGNLNGQVVAGMGMLALRSPCLRLCADRCFLRWIRTVFRCLANLELVRTDDLLWPTSFDDANSSEGHDDSRRLV